MKVILNAGYTRYLMDVSDAAKVMALLAEAPTVSYKYDDEGSGGRYEVDAKPQAITVETITTPIVGA